MVSIVYTNRVKYEKAFFLFWPLANAKMMLFANSFLKSENGHLCRTVMWTGKAKRFENEDIMPSKKGYCVAKILRNKLSVPPSCDCSL